MAVTLPDGSTHPTIYSSPGFPPPTGFIYHRVRPGDRLDNLAAQYFNDPEKWWIIANANPEVFYPDLDPGTTIRIPGVA